LVISLIHQDIRPDRRHVAGTTAKPLVNARVTFCWHLRFLLAPGLLLRFGTVTRQRQEWVSMIRVVIAVAAIGLMSLSAFI
jgi:hypothetical protein